MSGAVLNSNRSILTERNFNKHLAACRNVYLHIGLFFFVSATHDVIPVPNMTNNPGNKVNEPDEKDGTAAIKEIVSSMVHYWPPLHGGGILRISPEGRIKSQSNHLVSADVS